MDLWNEFNDVGIFGHETLLYPEENGMHIYAMRVLIEDTDDVWFFVEVNDDC
jgi:hypothetical protein